MVVDVSRFDSAAKFISFRIGLRRYAEVMAALVSWMASMIVGGVAVRTVSGELAAVVDFGMRFLMARMASSWVDSNLQSVVAGKSVVPANAACRSASGCGSKEISKVLVP
jgi:hypothetical protein